MTYVKIFSIKKEEEEEKKLKAKTVWRWCLLFLCCTNLELSSFRFPSQPSKLTSKLTSSNSILTSNTFSAFFLLFLLALPMSFSDVVCVCVCLCVCARVFVCVCVCV